MKSQVHAFTCGSCGGTLTEHVHEPTVRCPWCDTDNLLAGEDLPRTYWLEPLVTGRAAVRAVREATSRPDVEKGFSRALRIERRDLLFLPFNALRAIRTGRMLVKEEKIDRAGLHRHSMLGDALSPSLSSTAIAPLTQASSPRVPTRTTRDTKILLSEIILSEPACDASDLGADHIEFERNVFGARAPVLEPYSRGKIASLGSLLEPERHPRELTRRLDDAGVAQVGDKALRQIQSVGTQLYQVYYPVWVIRGTYASRSHRFVVDGVDATVVAGRVPASRGHLAAVGTAGVILASAPTALTLRASRWVLDNAGGDLGGDFLVLGGLAMVLAVSVGWGLTVMGWLLGSLRRSRELVFRAGDPVQDLVELPGRGPLEKMGLRLLDWTDRIISPSDRAAPHV